MRNRVLGSLGIALVSCVLAMPGVALAQDKAAAKEAQKKAFKAAQDGDYAAAIAAFEKAFKLDPDPNYLFNQAVLYQQWPGQHCEESLKAYARFFENCKACKTKSAAEKRFEQVKSACQVSLKVETTPPGAAVLLDGQSIGKGPASTVSAPGTHELVVRLDGYKETKQTVVLNAGQPSVTKVVLERSQGTLRLTGLSPSATVFVDGKQVAPRAGEVGLTTGKHQLRVEADGRARAESTIEIQADRVTTFELPPEKKVEPPTPVVVAQPSRRGNGLLIGGFVTGGLAVAGLAVGITYQILLDQTLQDEVAARRMVPRDEELILALRDQATTESNVRTGAFIAAGALGAASLTLFIIHAASGGDSEPEPGLSLYASPTGAGVFGRF